MNRIFYKQPSFQTIITATVVFMCLDFFFPLDFSLRAPKIASFHQVVTGDGEGKMTGYFGYVANPNLNLDEWFYAHLYVKVLPSADIHEIAAIADTSGYETSLVIEPLSYDPFPPRVTIRHCITLYPHNIQVWFTVIVTENGHLTINVNSDYFLRDDWMRSIFHRMLRDIHLSTDVLSRFELAVNHFVTYI